MSNQLSRLMGMIYIPFKHQVHQSLTSCLIHVLKLGQVSHTTVYLFLLVCWLSVAMNLFLRYLTLFVSSSLTLFRNQDNANFQPDNTCLHFKCRLCSRCSQSIDSLLSCWKALSQCFCCLTWNLGILTPEVLKTCRWNRRLLENIVWT